MRVRRKWRASVAAALAAVAAAVIAPVSIAPGAEAAGSTCTSNTRGFAGAQTYGTNFIRGAKATIANYYPALCGSSSDSSAWAMVAAPKLTNSNVLMYAQAGYARMGSTYVDPGDPSGNPTGLHKFAQRAKTCFPSCSSGSQWVTWYSADAPTTALTYVAKRLAADGQVHMYSNGVDVLQTGYDIADYWDLTSVNAQFAGEVIHQESDIGGTSSDPVSWYNIYYYKDDGSSNVPSTLVEQQTYTRHKVNTWTTSDGQQHMSTYTYPL